MAPYNYRYLLFELTTLKFDIVIKNVTFYLIQVRERPARVAMWINQNFLLGEELEASQSNSSTLPTTTSGGPELSYSPATER